VKLSGPLRLGAPVDKLDATLEELVDQRERRIVLDLEEVPSIDSSGIGCLIRALTATRQSGIAFKLVKPGKLVVQTLKLVRLLPLFQIYDDLEAAIASFENSGSAV